MRMLSPIFGRPLYNTYLESLQDLKFKLLSKSWVLKVFCEKTLLQHYFELFVSIKMHMKFRNRGSEENFDCFNHDIRYVIYLEVIKIGVVIMGR